MNKKLDAKRLVLLNLPYVFAFYFADKIAAVFRLAPGTEFIDKLTNWLCRVRHCLCKSACPAFIPLICSSVWLRQVRCSSWRSMSRARTARSSGRAKNTALPDGASRRTSSRTWIRSSRQQRHSHADGVL